MSHTNVVTEEKTTSFIYKIVNIKLLPEGIDSINSFGTKEDVFSIIEAIRNKGGKLVFEKMDNELYECNLVLIDSRLPEILAELVLQFYSGKINSVSELTQKLQTENPLGFNNSSSYNFYEYKITRFLEEVAYGMVPTKVWGGKYKANEGCLIAKENGDIVCYHIYNKNLFEDYLFHNTKLETVSNGKHNFGTIYEESSELYIKLNLEVRFR